ncbi:MAG: hypothetical protein ACTSUB_05575, partial [Candidatus Thorarchaeota archaeon]
SVVCLAFLLVSLSFSSIFTHQSIIPVSETNNKDFIISAEVPTLSLNYYSNWNTSLAPVNSGDRIVGDHITLNATWYPTILSNHTVIQVNATAIPAVISEESDYPSVEIDTRSIGNNVTCTINVTTWLLNGTPIFEVIPNVFIGNFFVPHVTVLSPNGGENWTSTNNITWVAWDNNTLETLTYEVLISADAGSTFQLISAEITQTWYEWDCSMFEHLDTYLVQVRVLDGIYTSYDFSDGVLSAGEILTTTTPPPTETTLPTTTDTNTTDSSTPPITTDFTVLTFIAAAIMSAAILSLIVYYQAKRQF